MLLLVIILNRQNEKESGEKSKKSEIIDGCHKSNNAHILVHEERSMLRA
jgi:hypothetical protein